MDRCTDPTLFKWHDSRPAISNSDFTMDTDSNGDAEHVLLITDPSLLHSFRANIVGNWLCNLVYTATYTPSTDVSYYSDSVTNQLFKVNFSGPDRALTTLSPADRSERDVAITITVAPTPAWRAA